MKLKRTKLLSCLIAAGCFAPLMSHATDGYFSHGYGMKAKGMGGASLATAQDSFGGANNPASMVFAGDRLDLGIDWFSPRRKAERTGSGGFGAGSLDVNVDSDSTSFYIPEFGYNKMLSPNMSLGVSVYGNGGMNTDYPGGQLNCGAGAGTANALCGSGRLGVDLSQLVIAPTLAYKVSANHSLGIAPLFGYQRFEAKGLQAFDNAPGFPPFTGSPGNVTNNSHDSSTGWGVRVGYMGRLTDSFTIGAAYASKMRMSPFGKYKGLFAEGGDFDIPEHYGAGVSFKPVDRWMVAMDYERINVNAIRAPGNPSNPMVALLGASNGPGFGWQNINVFKLGVQWQYSDKLALRVGYNHSDNPIRASDVTFNILAPGVVKDMYTAGFTYAVDAKSELTMAYMHAMNNSVTGSSFFNVFGAGIGGTEKISMYQNSLGIAYSWKF